jgi:hypothetical protein
MSARIVPQAPVSHHPHDPDGCADHPPAPPTTQMHDGVDPQACRRAVTEAALAGAGCVGSALWTMGSLPSVAGAVGGSVVTASACFAAGMKAAEADRACRAPDRPPIPVLTWSSDSS